MKDMIGVLIADDHPIFLKGLRQIIEADPSLKVVAEAEDGEAALKRIREQRPQVAILDIDMPVTDGFEVMRVIRDEGLAVEVIFLTMHKSEAIFNAALNLGVKGYVIKDSAITEIVKCIKAVYAGQNYISPVLSTYLLNRSSRAAALVKQNPSINKLTQTEQRVLRLIADNKTSKEIAGDLYISIRTVEHHRANICEKLQIHGSNALLKFAIAHKSELSSIVSANKEK